MSDKVKCPECYCDTVVRGFNCYCKNAHCKYNGYPIPACNCTGEVEGKPEMPERIWAQLEDVSFQGSDWIEGWSEEPCVINGENAPYLVQHKYLRSDLHEREIDNLKMLLEESKRQIATLQERDRQNTEMVASMTDQLDASLDKEKVRELVKAVDVLRNYAWDCMEGRKQTEKFVKLNCPVESLINSLFPEGVESEVKDE